MVELLLLLSVGLNASALRAQATGVSSASIKAQGSEASVPSAKAQAAHGDCRSCHGSHWRVLSQKTVPGRVQLVGPFSEMDAKCLQCHQGPSSPAVDHGASKLPMGVGRGSSHVDGLFLERAKGYSRLVISGPNKKVLLKSQCTGCHDPHAKDRHAYLRARAFDSLGKPMNVRPTTVAQICFACHAGPDAVRTLGQQSDLGTLFRPEAASAHRPGARAQARQDLPSLRSGLFKGTLDCTSCHDNSNATGPRGPHGSIYPHLLKAAFGREGDPASPGAQRGDLCFTCHDRTSILGNQSFPWHNQHIEGFSPATRLPRAGSLQPSSTSTRIPNPRVMSWARLGSAESLGQPAACSTCHDSHGSARWPALIGFDPAVVSRASLGVLEFQRLGLGHGSCTLSCHGHDHVQTRY